jgi:hypothetical protein
VWPEAGVKELLAALPKSRFMTDRIINSAWRLSVMGLICVAGVAGLFLGYRALFDLLAGRWSMGLIGAMIGIALGSATFLLCRHRDDLLAF